MLLLTQPVYIEMIEQGILEGRHHIEHILLPEYFDIYVGGNTYVEKTTNGKRWKLTEPPTLAELDNVPFLPHIYPGFIPYHIEQTKNGFFEMVKDDGFNHNRFQIMGEKETLESYAINISDISIKTCWHFTKTSIDDNYIWGYVDMNPCC